jgi:hypothetical protein
VSIAKSQQITAPIPPPSIAQDAPTNTPTAPTPPLPTEPEAPITGQDITFIGDSVTLASASALQAKFPGIYIDAETSRSLREGGFTTIDNLVATGMLRHIVVISLGTNGYYGTGKLDKLMTTLSDRKVILVTSHAPREWIAGNNQSLRTTAPNYSNMYIAEWDTAISANPDHLGPDGVHPTSSGGAIYADCIAAALAQIKE